MNAQQIMTAAIDYRKTFIAFDMLSKTIIQ